MKVFEEISNNNLISSKINNNNLMSSFLSNSQSLEAQNAYVVIDFEIQSSRRKGRLQRCSQIVVTFFEQLAERIKKLTTIIHFYGYTYMREDINKICSHVVMCLKNTDNTIYNKTTIRLQLDYNKNPNRHAPITRGDYSC